MDRAQSRVEAGVESVCDSVRRPCADKSGIDYIEICCPQQRRHSNLSYLTSAERWHWAIATYRDAHCSLGSSGYT